MQSGNGGYLVSDSQLAHHHHHNQHQFNHQNNFMQTSSVTNMVGGNVHPTTHFMPITSGVGLSTAQNVYSNNMNNNNSISNSINQTNANSMTGYVTQHYHPNSFNHQFNPLSPPPPFVQPMQFIPARQFNVATSSTSSSELSPIHVRKEVGQFVSEDERPLSTFGKQTSV
jgi:hypothetical protein